MPWPNGLLLADYSNPALMLNSDCGMARWSLLESSISVLGVAGRVYQLCGFLMPCICSTWTSLTEATE